MRLRAQRHHEPHARLRHRHHVSADRARGTRREHRDRHPWPARPRDHRQAALLSHVSSPETQTLVTIIAAPATPAEYDQFASRHIGPRDDDIRAMVAALGYSSLDAFIDAVIPESIRSRRPLALGEAQTEADSLAELARIAGKNEIWRSFLGQGYHGCVTPPVIRRNILENPNWYTAYTPYQAEVAQGRLEALLIFQTMIIDLTGLPVANASLLDEATAAAEAMSLAHAARGGDS